MIKSNEFRGIDIAKLIFAIAVVAIHTEIFTVFNAYEKIAYYFTAIAVPFFFIASGFFFAYVYQKNGNSAEKYMGNIKQLVRLYFLWGGVYSVLSLLTSCFKTKKILFTDILNMMHRFIIGSPGGGMWYVSALIISLLILRFVLKRSKTSFVLSIVIGLAFSAYPIIVDIQGPVSRFDNWYLSIFLTYRTFIFNYIFVAIGFTLFFIIKKVQLSICIVFIFSFIFIREAFFTGDSNIMASVSIHYLRILYYVSWFLLFGNLGRYIRFETRRFREMSNVIYFSHFFVITGLKFLLPVMIHASNKYFNIYLFVITLAVLFAYIRILVYFPRLKKLLY